MLCRNKDAQTGGIQDVLLRPLYVDTNLSLPESSEDSVNTQDSLRRLNSDVLLWGGWESDMRKIGGEHSRTTASVCWYW